MYKHHFLQNAKSDNHQHSPRKEEYSELKLHHQDEKLILLAIHSNHLSQILKQPQLQTDQAPEEKTDEKKMGEAAINLYIFELSSHCQHAIEFLHQKYFYPKSGSSIEKNQHPLP
ncbi:hypothetical protein ACOSP7_032324 [Xanthoceras sorbifolium]